MTTVPNPTDLGPDAPTWAIEPPEDWESVNLATGAQVRHWERKLTVFEDVSTVFVDVFRADYADDAFAKIWHEDARVAVFGAEELTPAGARQLAAALVAAADLIDPPALAATGPDAMHIAQPVPPPACQAVNDPEADATDPDACAHPCGLRADHLGDHVCSRCGDRWNRGTWDDEDDDLNPAGR